jgi:HTH-type transcriptional regulator/antitoxin HigA
MPAKNPPVAQVFPPGDFIREELEARGWTQGELARIIGRPIQVVNAIINGKKEITPETAVALGAAFGTSAVLWLNLQVAYRLAQAGEPDPAIENRARELELARR